MNIDSVELQVKSSKETINDIKTTAPFTNNGETNINEETMTITK